MKKGTDAVCIPAKCGKNHGNYYMVYYLSFDEKWVLTYGKEKLDQEIINNKNDNNTITVNIASTRIGPQYRCPYCGDRFFFTCWNCGKRTCYDGDNHDGREVICAHCTKSGVFRNTGAEKNNTSVTGISVGGQM